MIIKLWREFNLLLTHIIENIDVTALDHVWTMAGKELSLEFLVADYYRHLEEHLDQLKRRHRDVVKARKE